MHIDGGEHKQAIKKPTEIYGNTAHCIVIAIITKCTTVMTSYLISPSRRLHISPARD